MKKKKMKLDQLTINSFITGETQAQTTQVKGGRPVRSDIDGPVTIQNYCNSLDGRQTCTVCAYTGPICGSEFFPCEKSVNSPCEA